jgi:hypothetical protein
MLVFLGQFNISVNSFCCSTLASQAHVDIADGPSAGKIFVVCGVNKGLTVSITGAFTSFIGVAVTTGAGIAGV